MSKAYEQASSFIEQVEDPRKRAYLRFGMKVAVIDLRAPEAEPGFNVLFFLKLLDRMFDKSHIITAIISGAVDDQQWFLRTRSKNKEPDGEAT